MMKDRDWMQEKEKGIDRWKIKTHKIDRGGAKEDITILPITTSHIFNTSLPNCFARLKTVDVGMCRNGQWIIM